MWTFLYSLNQIVLFCGIPWHVSVEHFVENQADGEDVRLVGVFEVFKGLKRHVHR